MRKQARFIYGNAYNAQHGLLQYRVSPFLPGESFTGELIPLKQWCEINFYSTRQAMLLIKKKQLLALKLKGKWFVRLNPNCTLEDLRDESC